MTNKFEAKLAKTILSEKYLGETDTPAMAREDKKAFLEAVANYHQLGEMIYRANTLKEVASSLGNIVQMAENMTLQESEHWFDNVTVSRHMKQLQEAYKVFEKTAGEMSGNLDGMLRRLATYLERQHKLRQKVKMALVYPVAVLLIGVMVTAVILIWVVPVFQNIFASFGAELPAATLVVLRMSEGLLHSGPLALLWLLLLVLGLRSAYRRSEFWQLQTAIGLLRMPLAGVLMRASNDAIWTRCMATLLQSGVPLLDALEVTAGACPNRVYGLFTWSIRHAVTQGSSLSAAMQSVHLLLPQTRQKQSVFDDLLIQMVAVGEESGT
jgi:type II secretory pathway component PulF